ncbi:MAG: hypothetical protein DMG97_01820 [Acidobacteria bacterium]|nr:MAG: hypothetical protein DMG97_01820 [Acidobacteriota bacterium]
MRHAALFYNPISGRRKKHRLRDIETVQSILQGAGIEVEAAPTRAASDAAAQVRLAIRDGFDTIIACGGDGTIHDVLQGLAGKDAALGIIALPRSPVAADPATRSPRSSECHAQTNRGWTNRVS